LFVVAWVCAPKFAHLTYVPWAMVMFYGVKK